MMKKVILIAVLALALAACGGSAVETAQITVTMKEFAYDPNPITVAAGTPVEITLVNEGAVEHDFVIEVISVTDVSMDGAMEDHEMSGDHEEFDLHTSTPAGESSTLTFRPPNPARIKSFARFPVTRKPGWLPS